MNKQQKPEQLRSHLEQAAGILHKPDLKPRPAVTDTFEQNPLIKEENITKLAPRDRVREAVRRVVEDHQPVATVAKEMGLAPASVYKWRKEYFQLVEGGLVDEATGNPFMELNDGASKEDRLIRTNEQQQFQDNWSQLMETTHATEEDFHQDPWDVWLHNSDWTGWLYDDDGRLERSSLLGFLFLVLTVLAVFLMLMIDRPSTIITVTEPQTRPAAALMLRDELNLEKSYDVVKKFLAEDHWIRRLQYVRDRERVAPLVKDYYTRNPDEAVTNVLPMAGMIGTDQVSVAVECPGDERVYYFNLCVQSEEAAKSIHTHLIDWESSTMYQVPNIRRFIAIKPRTPTKLWLKATSADYHNRQFADAKVWDCYSLNFPGMVETFFGFVKADSRSGIDLKIATMRSSESPVIIIARYPDEILDPLMVEINEVIATEWLPATE
jgi:transposase-like protein